MNSSIFKTFFLSLCFIANIHFAYADTASILPPAKTTFVDQNGKPLTSGTVDFYIPSTTTRKTTWQDAGETIPNTNPVVLDAAGRALILGSGSYRQIVKDRNHNTIWDQVTSSVGSGSTPTTSTGDGDAVGTMKPWAGMTAPNQYLFTYGQEVSRTTYAILFTAITSTQAVFCSSGSPILTGLSDTTNFPIGASVELSCVVSGVSTIISKTSSTITLAANSNVNTNTNAVIFPWGHGNGSTTFNLPDLRGFVIAGNNNMGGVASSVLTTTFFGSANPNSVGGAGGTQSVTLSAASIPTLTSTNPATTAVSVTSTNTQVLQSAGPPDNFTSVAGSTTFDNQTRSAITSTGNVAINAINTISNSGGIAVSSTVAAVGSGYTNGSQTITVAGGTCTIQPQFTVTVSGNAFSGTPALLTAGNCTVAPSSPASTTGGGGTGGTLNVIYSAQSISLIQPTKTSNYIIKVTPDVNPLIANVVVNPYDQVMVFSNATDITIPSPSSKPLNGAVVLSNGGMSIFGGLFVNGGDAYFGNGANNTGVLGSGQVVLNVNGANAGAVGGAGGGCFDFDVGVAQIQTMTLGNSSCVLNGVGGYDPTPMWKSNSSRGWRLYSDARATDAIRFTDATIGSTMTLFSPSTGTGAGSSIIGQVTSGAGIWGIGHSSSLLGTAYDPTTMIYNATASYRLFGLGAGVLQTDATGTISTGIALVTLSGGTISLNTTNTDTAITINSPTTNYRMSALYLSNCTGTITTATFGLFTGTGGAGQIVGTTTGTVTGTTAGSAASLQSVNGTSTVFYNNSTLQFRNINPQGSPVTCKIDIQIQPLP